MQKMIAIRCCDSYQTFFFFSFFSLYGFSVAGKLSSGERSSLFDVPPAPQYCYRFFSSFNHSNFGYQTFFSSILYQVVGDNVSLSPYSVHPRPNKSFSLFIFLWWFIIFLSFHSARLSTSAHLVKREPMDGKFSSILIDLQYGIDFNSYFFFYDYSILLEFIHILRARRILIQFFRFTVFFFIWIYNCHVHPMHTQNVQIQESIEIKRDKNKWRIWFFSFIFLSNFYI